MQNLQSSNETPGQRLRRLRKARRLTQTALASTLGEKYGVNIEHGSIWSYEKDKNVPQPATYDVLADFFDVDLDYLRCLTNEPKTKPSVVYYPDVVELADAINELPNGVRQAVIQMSKSSMVSLMDLFGKQEEKLVDLRKRMVVQRGEDGARQWERNHDIKLPQTVD